MLIVKNTCTDPTFNLALEEALFKETTEDVFMLWRNRRAVIVGRNQNTVSEIDERFAKDNDIAVVRRLTGGGAVFHDLGNLNFTFIKRGEKDRFLDFAYFNRPIIELLSRYGLPAVTSERNDIVADGKKISGNAQTIYRDSVLHHGTILFQVDMSLLAKVLRPNPLKISSKAISSVRSRVANITELTGGRIDLDTFCREAENLVMTPGSVLLDAQAPQGGAAERLLARAQELQAARYATWEWNFGFSPAYSLEKAVYGDSGLVELKMDVADGRIQAVRLFGDFTGLIPAEELCARLTGVQREEKAIRAALNGVDVSHYIARMDAETLTELILS